MKHFQKLLRVIGTVLFTRKSKRKKGRRYMSKMTQSIACVKQQVRLEAWKRQIATIVARNRHKHLLLLCLVFRINLAVLCIGYNLFFKLLDFIHPTVISVDNRLQFIYTVFLFLTSAASAS